MLSSIVSPGRKDFTFRRGDSFSRTITIKVGTSSSSPLSPMDLTGYTAEVSLYEKFPIPHGKTPIAMMTVTIPVPATDGKITFAMTKTQTDELPAKMGMRLVLFQTAAPETTTHTIMEGILSAC